jgi:hypothetical protein
LMLKVMYPPLLNCQTVSFVLSLTPIIHLSKSKIKNISGWRYL